MTRLRRWWAGFWQALADALESVGVLPAHPDDEHDPEPSTERPHP